MALIGDFHEIHVKRLNIFLLIGQSNMAGRGRLSEIPPLFESDVFMFRDDDWVVAEEPLHTDKPGIAGIGLGMSYAERFRAMINSLRSDLSAPDVPVITGELGPFLKELDGYPFFELVNQQLRDLKNRLPVYGCANAHDLKDIGDNLHFESNSLREFGLRYARIYRKLREEVGD